MKKLILLATTALILAGCSTTTTPTTDTTVPANDTTAQTQPETQMPVAPTMAAPVVVQISAVKNSGQTGTATFTDLGEGKTKVEISLTGGKFTAAQPAHIHTGMCTKPGDVKYPLTDVVNGMSETTIDAPMSELWTGGLLVNVHKSAKEMSVYTACGDLVAPATTPAAMEPTTAPDTMTQPQGY